MSPSVAPSGVWTKLVYRKPPSTPKFLETPLNLFSEDTDFKDEREVSVRDVRKEVQRFTIEKEGFEFLDNTVGIQDWDNEDEVRRVIIKETPELIKNRCVFPPPSLWKPTLQVLTQLCISLGAKRVFLVTERIRRSDSSGIKSDTTPVFAIHGDATPESELKLLHENLPKMEPKPTSLPPSGRVMLVNMWRPLKTITRDPLAFLVPRSMGPGERHQQIFSRPAERFKVFGKPLGCPTMRITSGFS